MSRIINAKEELLEHIRDRKVKLVRIIYEYVYQIDNQDDREEIAGTLEEVLQKLDFTYDSGYGGQELFGYIWYEDGTWSERAEYHGSECWDYMVCPALDAKLIEDV